jgi:chromosome partitioning protein
MRRWKNSIDIIVADPRLSGVSVDKLPATNNIKDNNLLLIRHLQVIRFVLDNIENNYDYILIDSHPEVSDVLRGVIFASKYCVSPTIIAEMNNVNADVEMIRKGTGVKISHKDTKFAGSIGMMAREWGGGLKQSEALEYNRLKKTAPIFDTYVTEGDGLRQAAAARQPVFNINGANADKQSGQFRKLTEEFITKCK